MLNLSKYQKHGSIPKHCAQRNLSDRTHYVDDGSLSFHKSRILSTYIVNDGWLFALVESVGMNYENTKRGYRYVVFDVAGNVVSCVNLEDCFKTRRAAVKAMWAYLNMADTKALTQEALDRAERNAIAEIARMRAAAVQS